MYIVNTFASDSDDIYIGCCAIQDTDTSEKTKKKNQRLKTVRSSLNAVRIPQLSLHMVETNCTISDLGMHLLVENSYICADLEHDRLWNLERCVNVTAWWSTIVCNADKDASTMMVECEDHGCWLQVIILSFVILPSELAKRWIAACWSRLSQVSFVFWIQ